MGGLGMMMPKPNSHVNFEKKTWKQVASVPGSTLIYRNWLSSLGRLKRLMLVQELVDFEVAGVLQLAEVDRLGVDELDHVQIDVTIDAVGHEPSAVEVKDAFPGTAGEKHQIVTMFHQE